jgi:hypothetical protein
MLKVATTKGQRKLFFNLRSMKTGSDGLDSVQAAEIARILNVKPDEVIEMDTRMSGHDLALDGDSNDDQAFAPIHYLADHATEPLQVLEARAMTDCRPRDCRALWRWLDPRSRRIVEARWLMDEKRASLHDLAAEFGVSAERIRQVEAKALQKMPLKPGTDRIWLKSYPAGVPADIDADRYRSIPDLFDQIVGRHGDRPAFHNLGRTLSYSELEKLSRDFAAFLQTLPGMGKGERVAIMSPNVLQYPVVLFGILRAGMTVVNVNPMYTAKELAHQLRDSGARAIVVVENFAATLEKSGRTRPSNT